MTRAPIVRVLAPAFFLAAGLASYACSSPSKAVEASFTAATFAEQVAHGQTLYAEHCTRCHGDQGQGDEGPRVVGLAEGALPLDPPADRKHRKTRFVTVADVATFVVQTMPPKKAGTLSTDEYLAILAFDLKANGIDLGRDTLTLARAGELVIPR
jgi:cytochrome c